jgi:uncharacterized membrane protein YjjP (DUF1212 family)
MRNNIIERKASLAVNIGVSLLECGAEVKRAEESAEKVALSLGAKSCEVLTLVSFILLTYYSESGESITKSRSVRGGGVDFFRFERLNALSRDICGGKIDFEDAEKEFIKANKGTVIKKSRLYILSMTVAFCFALFFGGGISEALSSALCANTVQMMNLNFGNRRRNKLLFTCVTSFVAGISCLSAVKIGMAADYDTVAMGNIMLLVPGISIVSAARDFIGGDLLSGIIRFAESVLSALAIAVGFALPSLLL